MNEANEAMVYQYLECIKNMENLPFTKQQAVLPNDVNRMYFHRQMCQKIFGFDAANERYRYIRFKNITDNLDQVCSLYSNDDEWKLENDYDLSKMTEYLITFFSRDDVEAYLAGKVRELKCIRV